MVQDKKIANIPESGLRRIVVVGAGFAGLKLTRLLLNAKCQIVLLDKNNFHQFQPLFYQVATAGLEPAAISFPLRKVLQKHKHVHFRIARVEKIDPSNNTVYTDIGSLIYDDLIIASGATTNFFGIENIQRNAIPMKSVSEAIFLRNNILQNFENALNVTDVQETEELLNIVIVGGGPTGVELAGALAEMRKFILPKDYPELDFSLMKIYLFEASPNLLNGMSDMASGTALKYLLKLGVIVKLNTAVKDFDGRDVLLADGERHSTRTLIWAAGITSERLPGIGDLSIGKSKRLIVDHYNRIKDQKNIYAIGDIAYMETKKYPHGHPQVAQVALQQAKNLAYNLKRESRGAKHSPFAYKDKGSLATIGKNRAVADLPFIRFKGYFAWLLWSFVHLMSIVGVKNKLLIFLDWAWKYFTYDPSLRLLIKPKVRNSEARENIPIALSGKGK